MTSVLYCLNCAYFRFLVGPPVLLSRLTSFDISINSARIERSTTLRILGLHVDSSWTFVHHVNVKCRAAYIRLRRLFPFCHILSRSQELLITQALVISLFDYADVVYIPCISQQLLFRIQKKIQNSCLRLVYGMWFDYITPAYQQSRQLRPYQHFLLHLFCIIYLVLHSRAPVYLFNLLHRNVEFHADDVCDTSCQDLLSIPRHRTSKYCGFFTYCAAKYYNYLSQRVRSADSCNVFRAAATEFIAKNNITCQRNTVIFVLSMFYLYFIYYFCICLMGKAVISTFSCYRAFWSLSPFICSINYSPLRLASNKLQLLLI